VNADTILFAYRETYNPIITKIAKQVGPTTSVGYRKTHVAQLSYHIVKSFEPAK
jgi:hypothetical protein